MIDIGRLHGGLDDVESHLRRLGRRVVNLLQPGLSEEEIRGRTAKLPFLLTREIVALSQWRDGTLANAGDILDELNFFPGFYFLSLDEAIESYFEREPSSQWRKSWFPFFANGAGDFYIAPCPRRVVDSSSVIGFLHGEPEQVTEYESITTMVETLNAAYAENVFYLDRDTDTLEMNYDQYDAVAHRFNPEIEEWQS